MKIETNKMKYESGLDHILSLLVITSLSTRSYGKNILIDDMIDISRTNFEWEVMFNIIFIISIQLIYNIFIKTIISSVIRAAIKYLSCNGIWNKRNKISTLSHTKIEDRCSVRLVFLNISITNLKWHTLLILLLF